MRRPVLILALILALSAAFVSAPAWSQAGADVKRTEDVVYGRKSGMALTMDVFQPKEPNGAGIILVVSGGWVSDHGWLDGMLKGFLDPMLQRGYTVFGVCHGCQPKFHVPEIIQDMNRAVRFIRHHAGKHGVDPNRLGIMGASAGGHLSLVMGTSGGKGNEKAADPIDRESSAVQCVACFFPPTDFLNYGKPGEDAVGVGTLRAFRPAFGLKGDTPEERQQLGKQISPIYHISEKTVPTMIVHGDADTLVPIQQAEIFVKRCEELKVPARLIRRPGKGHGFWPEMPTDLALMADWFDQHLRGRKSAQ